MNPHVECAYCQESQTNRKSPIKWAGGKSWIVPTIEPFWNNHILKYGEDARLVEPFCGSSAITLALNPKNALLNDANFHLINFYRWIKLEGLTQPLEVRNTEVDYYRMRRVFNDLISNPISQDSQTSAYLFYYLNRTCFRGLCRFNSSGQFNTPYGNYKAVHYWPDFKRYQALFKNWQFKCLDFERLKINESDLLFLDPPYFNTFTDYCKGGFTMQDQERLVTWAAKLADAGTTVLASNSATTEMMDLYKGLGFTVTIIKAPRRMDAKSVQTSADEMFAGRNF